MTKETKNNELNDAQKRFCEEYIYDFNGSRAYKVAYPSVTDGSARVCSTNLLKKYSVIEYIKTLKGGYEKELCKKRVRYIANKDNIGYVYLIHCVGTTYYKIGKSVNGGKSRITSMQTGIPFDLNLLLDIKCKEYHTVEKELHKSFKNARVRGEWFTFSNTQLDEVKLKLWSYGE